MASIGRSSFLFAAGTLFSRIIGLLRESVIAGTFGASPLLDAFDVTKVKVVGHDGIEMRLRKEGIGVIHGGKNSLRFTPHFAISAREVDLVMDKVAKQLEIYSK